MVESVRLQRVQWRVPRASSAVLVQQSASKEMLAVGTPSAFLLPSTQTSPFHHSPAFSSMQALKSSIVTAWQRAAEHLQTAGGLISSTISACWRSCQGLADKQIIESLRLEKTPKITKSNRQPNTPCLLKMYWTGPAPQWLCCCSLVQREFSFLPCSLSHPCILSHGHRWTELCTASASRWAVPGEVMMAS